MRTVRPDHRIIPAPAVVELMPEQPFPLVPPPTIAIDSGRQEVRAAAEALASYFRAATGHHSPVVPMGIEDDSRIVVSLTRTGDLGPEGYSLDVDESAVRLAAGAPVGLFRGIQSVRQLLRSTADRLPAVRVRDYPRFGWRGLMLDVARHFMPVDAVVRFIDLMALYKMNVLHLHLSDDQGWRIHIDAWPRLADHGGSLQVGGTPGGYYTKPDYVEILRRAAANHITVVPEIDTPGHTNAALASYPELNCTGVPPPLYTGTKVGFSSLCIDREVTYQFLDDVVREIAELSPGDYFHIGGDEAHQTSVDEYLRFVGRAGQIVREHGKTLVGWHELAKAHVTPGSVAQYWGNTSSHDGRDLARVAVDKGMKLVTSPSDRAYLDMKYDPSTHLGLNWAGYTDVRKSYDWDPATLIDGVGEDDVLGVEAALWSETIADVPDAEFMLFPRLPGLAEIGWSQPNRSWEEYRIRLATHGGRWEALGINFYRSPQVPWERS
jgi:hexosaminidase